MSSLIHDSDKIAKLQVHIHVIIKRDVVVCWEPELVRMVAIRRHGWHRERSVFHIKRADSGGLV